MFLYDFVGRQHCNIDVRQSVDVSGTSLQN